MFPQFKADQKPKPKKEKKESTGEYSQDRIRMIIDGLDEQLAKGKISEKIYHELRKKWEARIK
jgi:hypothetical protein